MWKFWSSFIGRTQNFNDDELWYWLESLSNSKDTLRSLKCWLTNQMREGISFEGIHICMRVERINVTEKPLQLIVCRIFGRCAFAWVDIIIMHIANWHNNFSFAWTQQKLLRPSKLETMLLLTLPAFTRNGLCLFVRFPWAQITACPSSRFA